MADIKDIATAWIDSFNPTEQEKARADARLAVCSACSERTDIKVGNADITRVCGMCHCILSKKVYSRLNNPCPLEKWAEADKQYFKEAVKKEHKNLI